ETKFAQEKTALEGSESALALIAPRGIGPTRYAEVGKPADTHIKRRFALLGQTLDGQRVWDVRRGLAALQTLADFKGVPVWLAGHGDMAGVALYAGIFEPAVVELAVVRLPPSHQQGPIFLNVRRLLDTPQAVSLMFPRKVTIFERDDAGAKPWAWPLQLDK